MIRKSHVMACALAGVALFGPLIRAADSASGPTPFPPKDSPAAWPGKGVIRVFPWMTDNRNYFWTKRTEAQHSVVFIGDSLTGNWSSIGKDFPKAYIANRGIGGDVSRGMLFRFREDVLDLHPRAIVILAGTNDLSAKEPVEDALSNISDMIAMARKEFPTVPIILCTDPPRDSNEAPIDPSQLKALNDSLTKLAQSQQNLTLLDLFPLFALPDGSPDPQYFRPDKLHFGPAGYAKWQSALLPIFTNLKLM